MPLTSVEYSVAGIGCHDHVRVFDFANVPSDVDVTLPPTRHELDAWFAAINTDLDDGRLGYADSRDIVSVNRRLSAGTGRSFSYRLLLRGDTGDRWQRRGGK
jgi:hypothetical protein